MCKYCEYYNCNEKLINTMSHRSQGIAGIETHITVENTLRVKYTADTFESVSDTVEFKINYCPMCGRKLEE